MFASMVANPTPISRDHNKKLVKIIQTLLAYEQSNIFRKPIAHKSLGWQDYKEIVKKPIDLNFVRRQYNEGKYKYVEEVLDDIQLIWDNVFSYGKKQHETFDIAIKMQKYFDDLLNDHLHEYYEKINRVLYFKQFQPTKPQKKASSSHHQQKNNKKMEKMEAEIIKHEIKLQEPDNIMSRRKQTSNTRRAQNYGNNLSQENYYHSRRNNDNMGISNQIVLQEKLLPVSSIEKDHSAKQISVSGNKLPNQQHNETRRAPSGMYASVNNYISNNNQPLQQQSSVQQSLLLPNEAIQNQQSQQNHYPPILVNLNKTPSLQQINEISDMMKLLFELEQFETLSKVVKILTKHQKQNMIIDGQDVNFRMNQIHVSTYNKIRKDLEIKLYQIEQSQKVNNINLLKQKYNIKFQNNFESNNQSNNLNNQLNDNFKQQN